MKVKMFYGKVQDINDAFNSWAKGKGLTRDVIIHTVAFPAVAYGQYDTIAIVVYYPEGSPFDTET
jgi:hypothetical protein